MSPERSPEWIRRGLDAPGETGNVEVAGCPIHFAAWGEPGRPGIVLVHGSNAHLQWWRWVAPFLADQFRVVALDSSGNGDSGWREHYTGELFAAEIMAVAGAAQLGSRPFVVGHSFGGWVALETGVRHGSELGGVVMMDFTVAPPERHVEWGLRAEREGVQPRRALRVYDDPDSAAARFRFLPEQPDRYPEVRQHLARASLKQVDGGWTWKFDPTLFDYLEMGSDQARRYLDMRCRAAVVLAEHSEDEGAQDGEYMQSLRGAALPVFVIPGAHHHMMFEEPMAVVTAIKGIVLTWLQGDAMRHA